MISLDIILIQWESTFVAIELLLLIDYFVFLAKLKLKTMLKNGINCGT